MDSQFFVVPAGFRSRSANQLDDMCICTPIYFPQRGTGIGADIVMDDILYTILDMRLDNICYDSRTDRIAVGKLGADQSVSLFFPLTYKSIFLI